MPNPVENVQYIKYYNLINPQTTNETFQQSGKQDSFRHTEELASMYEN